MLSNLKEFIMKKDDKSVNDDFLPDILMKSNHEDLCTFAKSGVGSRYLQTLVTEKNKALCRKLLEAILSNGNPNTLSLMNNPMSCYLIEKIIQLNQEVIPPPIQNDLSHFIISNLSRLSLSPYGYHVVIAAVKNFSVEHRKLLILELENSVLLFSLIKSQYGTFVAQACVPFFSRRTVISIVNSLLGHAANIGRHEFATYFIQKFIDIWGPFPVTNLLAEHVMRHLRPLVQDIHGTFVVQSLLKARNGDTNIMVMAMKWIVKNLQAVVKSKPSVHVVLCMLHLLKDRPANSVPVEVRDVIGDLVKKLKEPISSAQPLLIKIACQEDAKPIVFILHNLLQKIDRSMEKKMDEVLIKHKKLLMKDSCGKELVTLISE